MSRRANTRFEVALQQAGQPAHEPFDTIRAVPPMGMDDRRLHRRRARGLTGDWRLLDYTACSDITLFGVSAVSEVKGKRPAQP